MGKLFEAKRVKDPINKGVATVKHFKDYIVPLVIAVLKAIEKTKERYQAKLSIFDGQSLDKTCIEFDKFVNDIEKKVNSGKKLSKQDMDKYYRYAMKIVQKYKGKKSPKKYRLLQAIIGCANTDYSNITDLDQENFINWLKKFRDEVYSLYQQEDNDENLDQSVVDLVNDLNADARDLGGSNPQNKLIYCDGLSNFMNGVTEKIKICGQVPLEKKELIGEVFNYVKKHGEQLFKLVKYSKEFNQENVVTETKYMPTEIAKKVRENLGKKENPSEDEMKEFLEAFSFIFENTHSTEDTKLNDTYSNYLWNCSNAHQICAHSIKNAEEAKKKLEKFKMDMEKLA